MCNTHGSLTSLPGIFSISFYTYHSWQNLAEFIAPIWNNLCFCIFVLFTILLLCSPSQQRSQKQASSLAERPTNHSQLQRLLMPSLPMTSCCQKQGAQSTPSLLPLCSIQLSWALTFQKSLSPDFSDTLFIKFPSYWSGHYLFCNASSPSSTWFFNVAILQELTSDLFIPLKNFLIHPYVSNPSIWKLPN